MTSIADIILTRRCPFCGEVTELDKNECDSCRSALPKSRIKAVNEALCAYPLPYQGVYREAVLRYKFRRQRYLAARLAVYMAEAVGSCFGGERFDLICYVPAYRDRAFKFNHSRLLAEKLSKILSLPCKEALVKRVKTQKQHNLSYELRKSNVKNAFAPNGDYTGASILLVDDIITTGNTMAECIRALRLGGVDRVCGIALCGPHRQ